MNTRFIVPSATAYPSGVSAPTMCRYTGDLLSQFFINNSNNITFIGFGSQEGWITTDIKTYTTNSKTMSTHQLFSKSLK